MLTKMLSGALLATVLIVLPASSRADEERVLQIVSPREITSLEPKDTGFHFRRLRVAETLLTIDPTGRLVGELAERWSVSDDGKTWRLAIRPDVKFHDGSDATPEAILTSFERVRPASELVSTAPIERVAVDGGDLVFSLSEPFSLLPSFLTDATVVILAPSAFGADGHVVEMLGTGPYRVTQIEGKDGIDLDAFPDYWGPPPGIARARFTAVKAQDTLANLAEAGQADLTFSIPVLLEDRIESSGHATLVITPTARTVILKFNMADPLFSDVRARQALSLAIDRPGIASVLYANPGAAANQLVSPALADWHDDTLGPIERDIAAAMHLLAEAGWTPGADGILEKDGARFSFNLFAGPDPEYATLGQALQDQLKMIGIEVTVEPGPWSSLLEKVATDSEQAHLGARNYAMVPDAIATLRVDYAADTADTHVWGGRHFVSPALDEAFTDYLVATTPNQIAKARESIQAILMDEVPVVPIAYRDFGVAVSERIDLDSVVVDPLELSYWIDRVKWAN